MPYNIQFMVASGVLQSLISISCTEGLAEGRRRWQLWSPWVEGIVRSRHFLEASMPTLGIACDLSQYQDSQHVQYQLHDQMVHQMCELVPNYSFVNFVTMRLLSRRECDSHSSLAPGLCTAWWFGWECAVRLRSVEPWKMVAPSCRLW